MRHTKVFGLTAIAHQLLQFLEVELVRDRKWVAGGAAQGVDAESARQG
jgi:hypothetical protein